MLLHTGQEKKSWGWLILLSIPVASFAFVEKCSGTAMTFTLKKYVDSPALITFLGSFNSLFAVVIASWAAYKSDHLNTFLGRRKTLITIGFILTAISLVMIPQVGGFAQLFVLILIYQFSVDMGYTGPWKPLYFDIIPKSQRGRGMIINRYASIGARFIFMFFLIGRFDQKVSFKKTSAALSSHRWGALTGEQIIYFSGAVLVLISLGIILLFIRETGPTKSKPKKIRIHDYLKQMFGVRQNFLLCILVISSVLMSTKLMNLRPLLITEQFGYSKQIFGTIHSVTMLINTMMVLPVLAILIDRIDKFKIFAFCICLSTLHPAVFWVYVKFFAPNGIPPVPAIIGFTVADSIFDRTALLALWPLVFDLIDSEKKGFMNSLFLTVAGLTAFLNTNLMGIWAQMSSSVSQSGKVDYMSCYLYIFVVGILGCLGTIHFSKNRRQVFSC